MTTAELSVDDPSAFVTAAQTPGSYAFTWPSEPLSYDAQSEFADDLFTTLRQTARAHGLHVRGVTRAGDRYWFDVVAR